MVNYKLYAPLLLSLLIAIPASFGQDFGEDVGGLTLTSLSSTVSRLAWEEVRSVECETSVTYSIFRGTSEDFTPSLSNRIANGLTKTTYLAKEPIAGKDYYYYVRFFTTPVSCTLQSGTIFVYPLDLGQEFTIQVGDNNAGVCTATSTSEMKCATPLPHFHAVVARQGTREYLIGCLSADYEDGDWTCVNLTSGIYHVGVHSRAVTVWNSGIAKINTRTGKTLSSITPTFSVLARIQP